MAKASNVFGRKLVLLVCGLSLLAMFGVSVVYRAANPNLTVHAKKKTSSMGAMASGMGGLQEMMAKVETEPDNVENLMNLANAFLMMRAWDRALVFLERAKALQPDNVGILKSVGICYFQKQMHEQAVEIYERILALQPGDALSHYNLGIIFKHYLNDPQSAATHFRIVADMPNGDGEMKKHARTELEELEKM